MAESVFKPGDSCDRYRIVRLLASGGQGEVYVATQEFMERDVALKTVRAPLADRQELHARMKTEAKLLGRIQHPNVVTVFDAGITATGVIYIAMQLLEGQTLRGALRAVKRVPIPQALQLAASIADGLEAAHEIGVVHRDVKPDNIFITDQNALKVLDLGTAKIIQAGLRTSRSDAAVGTLWYMPPEQIMSNKVTARSDVYALGLVLFEMIRGAHAFESVEGAPPDKYQLGLRQLYAEPTPLTEEIRGFPVYVWDLIARATAKDPETRHASMSEFAADVRAARRRLLDEVRAQGLVPGYVDLTQKVAPGLAGADPAPGRTATEELDPTRLTPARGEPAYATAPARYGLGPRNTVRLQPLSASDDSDRTLPDLVSPVSHRQMDERRSVSERSSVGEPLPVTDSTPQISQARSERSPTPSSVARRGGDSNPGLRSDDDAAQLERDAAEGLGVLFSLPDSEDFQAAFRKLEKWQGAEGLAIAAALGAVPRARGAYALALSSALIDLAQATGPARDSARALIEDAIRGYVPEVVPFLDPFPTFERALSTGLARPESVSRVTPSAGPPVESRGERPRDGGLAALTPVPISAPIAALSGARPRSVRRRWQFRYQSQVATGAVFGFLIASLAILAHTVARRCAGPGRGSAMALSASVDPPTSSAEPRSDRNAAAASPAADPPSAVRDTREPPAPPGAAPRALGGTPRPQSRPTESSPPKVKLPKSGL